jgi:protein gp37
MGEHSGIAWTHHSFNCWWGCVEVSAGCDHCYAREMALGRRKLAVWGKEAERHFFGDKYWQEPMRWNRRAQKTGQRARVFCMSMGDLGEERSDDVGRDLDRCRQRLWSLIATTPSLDWLLLTKRAHFYRRRVPTEILALPNVWPGVSVESPDALWRWDVLKRLASAGPLWISYEPALADVDFGLLPHAGDATDGRTLGWLVVGAESGAHRRPFELAWLQHAVDQCRAARVPIFVKQDSASVPGRQGRISDALWLKEFPCSFADRADRRPGAARTPILPADARGTKC